MSGATNISAYTFPPKEFLFRDSVPYENRTALDAPVAGYGLLVMKNRQLASAAYRAFKTSFKALLNDLGGIDAAASVTTVKRSQISRFSAPDYEMFPSVNVVFDLEVVGHTPHVTAALARAQGFRLVPDDICYFEGELAVQLSNVVKKCGFLIVTAAPAMRGEKPSEQERLDLLRELDDLVREALIAKLFLTQREDPK